MSQFLRCTGYCQDNLRAVLSSVETVLVLTYLKLIGADWVFTYLSIAGSGWLLTYLSIAGAGWLLTYLSIAGAGWLLTGRSSEN